MAVRGDCCCRSATALFFGKAPTDYAVHAASGHQVSVQVKENLKLQENICDGNNKRLSIIGRGNAHY